MLTSSSGIEERALGELLFERLDELVDPFAGERRDEIRCRAAARRARARAGLESASALLRTVMTGGLGARLEPSGLGERRRARRRGRPRGRRLRRRRTSAPMTAERMAAWSGYWGSSRPGVSARIIWTSPSVRMPTMRSRVDPRLFAGDAELLADESIEESGFACVGLSATVTVPARVMK